MYFFVEPKNQKKMFDKITFFKIQFVKCKIQKLPNGPNIKLLYKRCSNEALSPSEYLGCQFKSVANFIKYKLIVFKFSDTYTIKILRIPNMCFFL